MGRIRRHAATVLAVGILATVYLPGNLASAHGTPCRPSDTWSEGFSTFTIRAVWTCSESHYKYVIRSYVQHRVWPEPWVNVRGLTATNTKIQTTFISDNRATVGCVPLPGVVPHEYRVVIDYVKVYNSSNQLLKDHSSGPWQGPAHQSNCVRL